MANDANVFKNSTALTQNVIEENWSQEIEQVARQANYLRSLSDSIVVMDRVGTSGQKEYITKNTKLSAADVTDGDSVSVSALSFNQVEVISSIKAVATQITLKNLREELVNIRSDVISNMGLAIAEKEEADIFTELYTTGQTDIYVNGKTSANITSSDTFNLALINSGRTAMEISNRVPRNLFIHPVQAGAIRALQQFTDASQLGSDRVISDAMIGTVYGIRVFTSNNVTSVTENSIDVYQALLLGDRAAVIMDKARPTVEMDRVDITRLSMTMQVWSDYGVQILNDESIRVLKSA